MVTVEHSLLLELNSHGIDRIPEEIRNVLDDTTHSRILITNPAKFNRTWQVNLPESYRSEQIDGLLQGKEISEEKRKFLVDLIRKQPYLLDIMLTFIDSETNPLYRIMPYLYPEDHSLDFVDIIFTFSTGYILQLERLTRILTLSTKAIETIYGIYGTNNLFEITSKEVHPLEEYVYAIVEVKAEDVAQLSAQFGMMIPSHLPTVEHRSYALQWMPTYKYVLTRQEAGGGEIKRPHTFFELVDILNTWTDAEILNRFGQVDVFNTRNAMIDNIFRLMEEQGFILLSRLDENLTTNSSTTLGTPVEELTTPYLVFGTPFEYRAIELDELLANWQDVKGGKFPRIGEEGWCTITQVWKLSNLLALLSPLSSTPFKISLLREKIDEGILSSMKREAEIDELIRNLTVLNSPILKKIFENMFFLGQYMRGWQGPGNSYPTRVDDKGEGDTVKSEIVRAKITTLIKSLDKKTLYDLRKLPVAEYHKNAYSLILTKPLLNHMDKSEYLIDSASYYLAVMFSTKEMGQSILV